MEGIKQWAFSMCAAMVACGLAQLLLPRAGMEKAFRITVSVFFLCCLLSPVVLQKPELRIEVEQYTQSDIQERVNRLERVVDAQTGEVAKAELQKIIGAKLSEMGIKYQDITININTNGQSGQEIDTVEIVLDRAHEKDHDSIRAQLSRDLGLTIRLGYADLPQEEE